MTNNKITRRDQPRIREWKNVREASVDKDGDVWVCDPCVGHWLNDGAKSEYIAWRASLMSPATRQAASRQARTGAGGKAIGVVLSPDAAEALRELMDARYADTIAGTIDRALTDAMAEHYNHDLATVPAAGVKLK